MIEFVPEFHFIEWRRCGRADDAQILPRDRDGQVQLDRLPPGRRFPVRRHPLCGIVHFFAS
jgi:hypothetical protein